VLEEAFFKQPPCTFKSGFQSNNPMAPISQAKTWLIKILSVFFCQDTDTHLVPAVVQPHGHGADEGLDAGRRLVVGRPETPPNILVVQHLMGYLGTYMNWQILVLRQIVLVLCPFA
jgi:hypothetical protein